MIGAEDLPEEGPEGQPGGGEDPLPGGPFFLEDLLDLGLGEDGVEAQRGPGGGPVSEPGELETEPSAR